MNSDTLKDLLLDKLQKHDYDGLKGSHLAVYVPLQEKILNIIVQTIIASSDKMQDFESIYFSELNENEFLVYIGHKKLNKTVRCRILEIDHNHQSEAVLIIEFLEGIHFYEKIALESAKTLKRGWKWFKEQWKEKAESPEKEKPAVEISSSKLKINLFQILKQQGLDYLNPLILWKSITTHENKLIIDFSIKI